MDLQGEASISSYKKFADSKVSNLDLVFPLQLPLSVPRFLEKPIESWLESRGFTLPNEQVDFGEGYDFAKLMTW